MITDSLVSTVGWRRAELEGKRRVTGGLEGPLLAVPGLKAAERNSNKHAEEKLLERRAEELARLDQAHPAEADEGKTLCRDDF